jgi:hypothetical protein
MVDKIMNCVDLMTNRSVLVQLPPLVPAQLPPDLRTVLEWLTCDSASQRIVLEMAALDQVLYTLDRTQQQLRRHAIMDRAPEVAKRVVDGLNRIYEHRASLWSAAADRQQQKDLAHSLPPPPPPPPPPPLGPRGPPPGVWRSEI